MIVLPAVSADDGWIPLFDGKSLEGWRASENTATWSAKEGFLESDGPRSHLFYQGRVRNADFKNFELKAEVMSRRGANSGIFFHAAFQCQGWPEKGFEVQICNTCQGEGDYRERKKTGSLYGVRNVYRKWCQAKITPISRLGVAAISLLRKWGNFSLTPFANSESLSALGLRGTMNQRGEFLMTTTPVADLRRAPSTSPIYFPQFVDGGGYTISLALLNTSTDTEIGTLQILGDGGAPRVVKPVGGTPDSSFRYSIPPRRRFPISNGRLPGRSAKGMGAVAPCVQPNPDRLWSVQL